MTPLWIVPALAIVLAILLLSRKAKGKTQ